MTEDIRIKLSADEKGAVAAFQRLREEVLNSEKGIKRVGDQGKLSGKALKDMASVLGPEFQILGDRIDHVSGALTDIKGAGFLAKASLVALVTVGAGQVGDMIGNWIAKTEEWTEAHKKAIEQIKSGQEFLGKLTQSRFEKQIEIANLAATKEQRNEELSRLRVQKMNEMLEARNQLVEDEKTLRVALGNDILGYGTEDNAIAEEAVRLSKERVKQLTEQFNLVDKLRYREGPTGLDAELKKRQDAADKIAKAEAEKAKAMEQQAAAQARLSDMQDNYLANLELELTRIRDGEEAFERAKLKQQGFAPDAINRAIELRNEIDALKKAAEKATDSDSPAAVAANRELGAPGAVQATQQRFLTRGAGIRDQDKLLKAQEAMLAKLDAQTRETKRAADTLDERLPKVTY